MTIQTVRRLAADIFGVGESRVKFSPDGVGEAKGALTRDDVRALIKKGVVRKIPVTGRASTRKRERRTTAGIRGKRVSTKEEWIMKVRAQRRFLEFLVTEKALKTDDKRDVYYKVKSGIFRNKKAMLLYLKDNGLVAKNYEPVKPKIAMSAKLALKRGSVPKGQKPKEKTPVTVKPTTPGSLQHQHAASKSTASPPHQATASKNKKGEKK